MLFRSDLGTLMDSLEIDAPIHMIVHDWGGMIGFGWAAHHADKIGRMVVANTAAFPMPSDKRLPVALWLVRNTKLGALLVQGLNAFSGIASRVAFKQPVSAEIRKGYTGPYDSWENRIATLRFVQDIPLRPADSGYDLVVETESRLPLFAEKPCLIAWGEKDFVFDAPFLRRWKQEFPQAQVLSYPDYGHYIIEDGGQPLADAIREFLTDDDQPKIGRAHV